MITSPAKSLHSSLSELEKLLHSAAISKSKPKVNILQNDNWTELRIAVPGINKKSIDINLLNNVLKIEAKNEEEKKLKKDSSILLKEFDFANFSIEYKLNEKVNLENISAKYQNGILIVKLPFKNEEELNKTKKIVLK